MAGVATAVVLLVLLALLPVVMLSVLGAGPLPWRLATLLARLRARRRTLPPVCPVRPIEQVASDVRRISERYHQPGMRFAQYEGRRQAYDRVLGEAADMLRIPHLLGVLAPGPELDHERLRVERLLAASGLLPDAA